MNIPSYRNHCKFLFKYFMFMLSVLVSGITYGQNIPLINVEYIDSASIMDTNGNGSPELALLAKNTDGRAQVYIQDIGSGKVIRLFGNYARNFEPISITVIPDYNSNGYEELVVLGNQKFTNIPTTIIRDSVTKEIITKTEPPLFFPEKGNITFEVNGELIPKETTTVTLTIKNNTGFDIKWNDSLISGIPSVVSEYVAIRNTTVPDVNSIPDDSGINIIFDVFNKTDVNLVLAGSGLASLVISITSIEDINLLFDNPNSLSGMSGSIPPDLISNGLEIIVNDVIKRLLDCMIIYLDTVIREAGGMPDV